MSNASNLMTADELLTRPGLDKHCQLIRGELIRTLPTDGRHGQVAGELGRQLANHCYSHKLGTAFAAETGFWVERNPDTVLAPDAAYVANHRIPKNFDRNGYPPLAPDFVAEVRSMHDSVSAMQAKAKAWHDAGCTIVVTVDPETETVCRYQSSGEVDTFAKGESVDCSAAVPGWVLNTTEFFED